MLFRLRAIVFLLSASAALATAGEKPWIEVRSPHFRVLTNGGTKDARRVAHEFEQMRYIFATQFPTSVGIGCPTAGSRSPRRTHRKGAGTGIVEDQGS